MGAICYNLQNHRTGLFGMSDNQIDELAEKVAEKILLNPEHRADHDWVKAKREIEADNRTRRRQIVDRIVGAVGTAGVFGLLGWIGHAIINFLQDVAARGGPP